MWAVENDIAATGTSYLELEKMPEGAAPAPIPSTKIAVIRSFRESLYALNVQNILNTHEVTRGWEVH
jgi:hypothetical protein